MHKSILSPFFDVFYKININIEKILGIKKDSITYLHFDHATDIFSPISALGGHVYIHVESEYMKTILQQILDYDRCVPKKVGKKKIQEPSKKAMNNKIKKFHRKKFAVDMHGTKVFMQLCHYHYYDIALYHLNHRRKLYQFTIDEVIHQYRNDMKLYLDQTHTNFKNIHINKQASRYDNAILSICPSRIQDHSLYHAHRQLKLMIPKLDRNELTKNVLVVGKIPKIKQSIIRSKSSKQFIHIRHQLKRANPFLLNVHPFLYYLETWISTMLQQIKSDGIVAILIQKEPQNFYYWIYKIMKDFGIAADIVEDENVILIYGKRVVSPFQELPPF